MMRIESKAGNAYSVLFGAYLAFGHNCHSMADFIDLWRQLVAALQPAQLFTTQLSLHAQQRAKSFIESSWPLKGQNNFMMWYDAGSGYILVNPGQHVVSGLGSLQPQEILSGRWEIALRLWDCAYYNPTIRHNLSAALAQCPQADSVSLPSKLVLTYNYKNRQHLQTGFAAMEAFFQQFVACIQDLDYISSNPQWQSGPWFLV